MGNNSRMDSPRVSRDLVLQNLKNIDFICTSQYFKGGPTKVTCLFISPNNNFRDHSHQNRLKKLVPRAHFSKHVSEKHLRKSTKHFSKPDFLVKFGFPKTRVSSPAAPRGVYISRKRPHEKMLSRRNEKTGKLAKNKYFVHGS